jgi:N-dimethylarginine dimethylaminohydrolase|tara:strand:- start:266 stop:1180 length:915 start_codon:yes stop_codon:yes gene_type:complete
MGLLKINNEIGMLKTVVLGIADDFGGAPKESECYDPKSKEHVKKGTFPIESDLCDELKQFHNILIKYNVEVLRPKSIEKLNQIFARDIAFVIADKIIISNTIEDRKREVNGINHILESLNSDSILKLSENSRIEGGDVIVHNDYVFIGHSNEEDFKKYKVSRTNSHAVNNIRDLFSSKKVVAFELNKSDINAKENALHLDCCFQPIGKNMAIIYEGGFKNNNDIVFLNNLFGKENLINISKDEMYNMHSNIFSISDNVIVSEKSFDRLNSILRKKGFIVEMINFSQIAKMEGLLRCSTLPLNRL